MGFFAYFLISLAFTVVSELIRPKPSVPNAKAAAEDDFDLPTAEYNRAIPVIVGRVRITGANVVASGDLRKVALTKKVKTGLFSSKRQTYAYKYYLGIQHLIGWGRDDMTLHDVRFDNILSAPSRAVQPDGSTLLTFRQEALFGGNEEGGGVSGTMRFYPGNQTQLGNAYLQRIIGEEAPAYRGICHLVIEGMYLGTSSYIKGLKLDLSSYPNQLGVTGGKHIIEQDANPFCFIYEVFTEAKWAIGKSPSQLNVAEFRRVAEVVHAEGLGMSMMYNGASSGDDLIADIVRHVDGFIYTDPQTGLITPGLARDDYAIADLPVFGVDDVNVDGEINFSRPSWGETRNTISVSYTDRDQDYSVNSFPLQDLANIIQREGEVSSDGVDFSGFTRKQPALDMGQRTLNAYAYPVGALQVTLMRSAWRLHEGSVFVFSWPPLGLLNVVFRVTRIDRSRIEENKITISAVEDIFSVSRNSYDAPPSSEWVNPVQEPTPLLRQALVEAPYFLLQEPDASAISFATPTGGLTMGYNIATGPAADALEVTGNSEDFSSSAVLSAAYSSTATGPLLLAGFAGTDELNTAPTPNDVATGDTLVLVKSSTTEEIFSYTGIDITTGSLTGIKRGLFDTVPQNLPIGAQAWFVTTGFAEASPQPYLTLPATMYAKLLPYTPLGTLALADAALLSLTLTGRALRPYSPGRIRVNTVYPPQLTSPVVGAFSYGWAHRNRTQVTVVGQDDPSVTPEEGTTYTIRLFNSGSLLLAKTGISPTAAGASIQVAGLVGPLTVEIVSVRDGLESWQAQRHTFAYDGTGIAVTQITADEAVYVIDGGGPSG